MRIVMKLLGLWAVGRTVTSTTPLFARLAIHVATIAFLGLFILLLAMTLVISGLWVIYDQMLVMGIAGVTAKMIVFLLILILMLVAAIFIQRYVLKIRANAHEIMFAQAPVSGRVTYVVDAFLRGLQKPSKL